MTREWLVPALRWLVSGLVGLLVAFLAERFGVEVTADNRAFLETTLTTLGLALAGAVATLVSKWLKPRFLRSYHPGR